MRFIFPLLALALFSFCPGRSARAGLILNGDFESGNTGFTSDFTFSPGNIVPASTYDIVTSPRLSHGSAASYGDHTTGSGLMLAANGSTSPNTAVWSQMVNVSQGQTYEFGVWTSSWFSPAGLQLQINSVDVGAGFATPGTNGVWEQTVRTWSSGTATTALISLINTTTAFSGNDFALDDITFDSTSTAAVPEPSTCCIFAGFALVAAGMRRRKYS
ncbi:MAG: hypothetical protein AAF483_30065 [Planctomycetota bacterium]